MTSSSSAYTVGTFTAPNSYHDCPTAVTVGSASVALGPTDTAGAKLQQLVALIAQQEGLTLAPGGTDRVVTADGTQLG